MSEDLMSKIRSLFDKPTSPEFETPPKVENRNVAVNPDAPRQQHYYFVHQYLTERAGHNAKFLVDKLREDSASKYLSILWISRGQAAKADEDAFIPADGLECFPVEIDDEHYGVIIQFPKPERMTEAYFVAIIVNPENNDSNYHRFITLEFSKNSDGSKCTVLGEWKGGSHFNYGDGGAPQREAFLNAICNLGFNHPKRNIEEKSQKSAQSYTFKVHCSFEIQYTFSSDEIQNDPDGDEDDFEPTDEALALLEQELEEHLLNLYVVDDVNVNVSADSNSIIGISNFKTSDEK